MLTPIIKTTYTKTKLYNGQVFTEYLHLLDDVVEQTATYVYSLPLLNVSNDDMVTLSTTVTPTRYWVNSNGYEQTQQKSKPQMELWA